MRTVFILSSLILFPLMCFSAVNTDGSHLGSSESNNPPVLNPSVDITVLNTFTCPYAQQILGLDYANSSDTLIFSSNVDQSWFECDPDDGTYLNSLSLPYSGAFGVAVNDDFTVTFGSSFIDTLIHWYDTSFHTFANPAQDDGRGMDFDGTYLWETYGPDLGPYQVARFLPDGSGNNYYSVSGISEQISGITVFPHDGSWRVVLTCYDIHNFYFYDFDGSSLTFLESASCPLSCNASLDLAYSSNRDTYFWSYRTTSSVYTISELTISLIPTSIQPTSLGHVKAMYK